MSELSLLKSVSNIRDVDPLDNITLNSISFSDTQLLMIHYFCQKIYIFV